MAWEFTDDRGVTVRSERRPERVAAYLRAGAGLADLGVLPVAVFGSGHDGDRPDPAKWGPEAPAGIPYLGASGALDEERLLSERPDLIVDVTYDGKHAYAVDDGAAERARLPVLALSVAGEVPQARLLERFAELAVALGGRVGEGTERLAAAEARLRTAALRAPGVRVLALSPAGPEKVHLARPLAWPELRRLVDLGVGLTDPGEEGGVNWRTAGWDRAVGLTPDLVLSDARGNADQPAALAELPAWRALTATAPVLPWNPELPCSRRATAAFLEQVAGALEGLAGTA
ncbi:TroA family protein [Streptomyces albidoflavus]|uniref:ABC transporter substrate-binding protein n=1 Tax=Streptomyces albidoflavus TaxID=1886 RepID=UPI001020D37B|nr:ABC transporter substrate-binding protein [Streptomyces albidoflavus]RZD71021.1 ABC transporter substrate-binding protein [Streptomyces albidoflavus]